MYKQAKWDEPLIFEVGKHSKQGLLVDDEFRQEFLDAINDIPGEYLRKTGPLIPSLSEVEVVRHFTRLSQMSYGIDVGSVPLGSCTMKYNPKVSEDIAGRDSVCFIHPYQDESTIQGLLRILYLMQTWLKEITGTDVCSLQPPAGASGELAGALMIRKYHEDRGELDRNEMLIPDSAHGSNPASAVMAGFKVVKIPTDPNGDTDVDALRASISNRTAGIMLTNPSTLGLFESRILEISDIVHKAGGLLYYDGANLNGILGIARPGDMGFDVVHINLHKTFAAPHGGGGPGAGAVCAKGVLKDYVPAPIVDYDGRRFYFKYDVRRSIGRVSWFYGNIVPIIKSFIYLACLGPRVREVAEISVLNTNYFMKEVTKLPGVDLVYGRDRWRKHEVVLSFNKLHRDTGVTAEDIAKALLDRGFHAPTIYFPLIVPEAHMVELTESESKEYIDSLVEAYKGIVRQAYSAPESLRRAPQNTSIKRLDPLPANHPRTMAPTYKYIGRLKEHRKLLKG
ncbi:MAG: glycine dehydrogenase (aminomethyl-transferring) [Desulfurococcales archaeon ex4484_204]|nr:MAG: glycine dehydrogenase (aminomethyl-transferring) [Desulfurococcales archaeon ex4484_204]